MKGAEHGRDLSPASEYSPFRDFLDPQSLQHITRVFSLPLKTLVGLSDELRESVRRGRREDLVHDLRQSANYLLQTLNELKELSVLSSGEVVLRPETFNVSEEFERLVALFRWQLSKGGIEALFTNHGKKLPLIRIDSLRLRQIILCLLANAAQFTEQGRITLYAEWIGNNGTGDLLVFVEDTGPGIPEEYRQSIFLPFFSIPDGRGGAGLGLSIVHRLLVQMGGEISLESEVSKGSRFTLRFRGLEVVDSGESSSKAEQVEEIIESTETGGAEQTALREASANRFSPDAVLFRASKVLRERGFPEEIAKWARQKLQDKDYCFLNSSSAVAELAAAAESFDPKAIESAWESLEAACRTEE
ncbi:hypothetical protein JCM12856_06820 [Spirochaeta dissipatitropha]